MSEIPSLKKDKIYLKEGKYSFLRDGEKISVEMDHYRQATKWGCSETSVKMVMRFLGIDLHDLLVAELYVLQGIERMEDLVNRILKLHDKDIRCKLTNAPSHPERSFDLIKAGLRLGLPPILRFVPRWQRGRHSAVCYGIDKTNIYLNDPAFKKPISHDRHDFWNLWRNTNFLMMSFFPL